MAAIYFLAGCIAGLAIGWYLTRFFYESKQSDDKKHPEGNQGNRLTESFSGKESPGDD